MGGGLEIKILMGEDDMRESGPPSTSKLNNHRTIAAVILMRTLDYTGSGSSVLPRHSGSKFDWDHGS